MSKTLICAVLFLILAVLLVTLPPFLDKVFDPLKGIAPLFHRGTPWGFHQHQIPDQTGKTILITGANAGLGYWSAYHLAANNANVVMACRNMKKAEAAKLQILETFPDANVETKQLDLSDLQSVKTFAEDFLNSHTKLDSLILNAGVMHPPFTLSKQNLELQFAVNHLGHFYLTQILLPLLVKSAPATVVSVSSTGHWMADEVWTSTDLLNSELQYKMWKHYPNSKLANILFAQELHSRLRNDGVENVYVNSVHPGGVQTELLRHWGWIPGLIPFTEMLTDAGLLMWKPEDAALTQLYTAVSPDIFEHGISGKYFHPIARETAPSKASKNVQNQRELWSWSEEMLKNFEKGKPLFVS